MNKCDVDSKYYVSAKRFHKLQIPMQDVIRLIKEKFELPKDASINFPISQWSQYSKRINHYPIILSDEDNIEINWTEILE